MMEVEVPQGAHMVDLETAHFKPFQPVARGKCTSGGAFRLCLAEHSLCLEITPDRRVGSNRGVAPFERSAQIVEMQLHCPARVFPIQKCKHLNDWRCQAWKATDITPQTIL